MSGAENFARSFGVSRETYERLERFVGLLGKWQPAQNLVSATTLANVWTRHVADSAQLLDLAPNALRWLDLGSGAGFPGVVLAIMLNSRAGSITLVESNQRKCAFLRAALQAADSLATIRCERIESVLEQWRDPVDVITARAVAPLSILCQWMAPLLGGGTRALLHKGREIDRELAEAALQWRIDLVRHPSRVEKGSWIVEIRSLERRAGPTGSLP